MKYSFRRVAFGVGPIPALVGFPKGKIRIRQRNDDFVRIFILTKRRIIATCPVIHQGKWRYCPELNQGVNAR